MKIIEAGSRITREELKEMAEQLFGDLVKAVVDIRERIMAVDAELHADQESFLLKRGSKQEHHNLLEVSLFLQTIYDITPPEF